jgi:hypothetical protein
MLPAYKQKANIGLSFGYVVFAVGFIFGFSPIDNSQLATSIGLLVAFGGHGLFVWGCWNYAKSKGYSGALGLLGLLSAYGLLILVLLSDKHK